MLNGLDLFSGIGGIALAMEPWVLPVAFCEIDRYAQSVLLSRMAAGELHCAPIWDDIKTLEAKELPAIDIITGGFPCQDISLAGTGAGLAGKRSGLFYEIARLANDLRPQFIFLENVPAITSRGGYEVIGALTEMGYDCRWITLSAAEVGANHIRERWWLLAHAGSVGCQRKPNTASGDNKNRPRPGGEKAAGRIAAGGQMADSSSPRRHEGQRQPGGQARDEARREGFNRLGAEIPNANSAGREKFDAPDLAARSGFDTGGASNPWDASWWATEPGMGRVAYGVRQRVDRIKCLGNAVVPLQARTVFKILAGIK